MNVNRSESVLVTGTFLDGLACDIPSQNWGPAEWSRQFDVFREMGMDTVIVIRVGWRDLGMYASRVMPTPIVERDDLVQLFLDESQRTGMQLYLGVYDGSDWMQTPAWGEEIALNFDLIEELLERYGQHPAFHGWYLSHEPALSLEPWQIWEPLAARMRQRTPAKPILISPRYEGRKWLPKAPKAPADYAAEFDAALGRLTQKLDHAAFMDGHCGVTELADYAAAMAPVVARHGMAFWSNLETFDRDMPFRFPPIDWLKMRHKLEAVQPFVSKVITFEAAHFLSPYSMWESGRALYRRYMEYAKGTAAPRGQDARQH